MAKVFTKPINKGTTERRLLWKSDHQGIPEYLDMAPYLHSEVLKAIEAEEHDIDDALRQLIDDMLTARSPQYVKRISTISRAVKAIAGPLDYKFDGDACFVALSAIMSPSCKLCAHPKVPTLLVTDLAAALFKTGYTGGYGSPDAAQGLITAANVAGLETVNGKRVVDLTLLADEIRLGSHPKGTAAALRDSIMYGESVDPDELRVRGTSLQKMLPNTEMYAVGEYFVMNLGRFCCVFSPQARFNLAECIHSIAGRTLAGYLDERPRAADACMQTLKYALSSLANRITKNKNPESLARCLKSSYSVKLCDMQDDADAITLAEQRTGLVAEVDAACEEDVKYHDILGHMEDELALDYGTVWNILPPPDIDLDLMSAALEQKMNAPRVINNAAWDDFITYSLAQITGNYLAAHPDEVVNWARGDAEGEEWVIACRSGKRTSAPADKRNWMVGKLPWKHHLENWHHTAQDVTHVFADKQMYLKESPPLESGDANELIYVLKHGNLLSGKYTPAFVRQCWQGGSLPGDRILFAAGKAENTKFGAKARETMSADDVLRECLTEIDINAAVVSRYCNGVAMRAGRAGTERLISEVVNEAANGSILLSMDISGWSPNMVREGEMRFIDAMMSLFDIPAAQRAGCIFKDLNVVFKREGFYRSFIARDGSVQGFFGTMDTLLHSMMSLWVLNVAKRENRAPLAARLARVTLIDDILLAVKKGGLEMRDVINMFVTGYASLGFKVDVVKTLAGNTTGVFLNRVYTSKGEITTSCKIFAAADREWDRQVIGIDDECASILAGFAGAADRGYSAARAYYAACYRIAQRCVAVCFPDTIISKALFGLAAFLPSGVGGLNIPDISTWLTETGGGTAAARFAVVYSVLAHARKNDQDLYRLCRCVINHLTESFDSDASAWAKATIPDGVSCKGVTNPASIITGYARKAVRGIRASSDIATLLLTTVPEDVDEYIDKLCRSIGYDSHVLSDYMSALPFAVSEAMMARFIRSDACFSIMRIRDRIACRNRVRRHSRSTLTRMAKMVAEDTPTFIESPTDLAAFAIAKRLEGWVLTNTVIPAMPDCVRHAPGSSDIIVTLTRYGGRTPCGGPSTINRTYASAAVQKGSLPNEREISPLHSAFRRATFAISFLASTGSPVEPLWELYSATWNMDHIPSLILPVPDVNLRRVALKTSHRSHSVRAYTNCAHDAAVDLHNGMNRYASNRLNIDFMAIRAWLQAATLVDAELGLPLGTRRQYEICAQRGLIAVGRSPHCTDWPSVAMIRRTLPDVMSGIARSSVTDGSAIEILISDFGHITHTAPRAASPAVIAGSVGIRALASALKGDITTTTQAAPQGLNDDDSKPVFTREMRDEYKTIKSVCDKAMGMDKDEFADFAQNMGKAMSTAAAKINIPEVQNTVKRICAGRKSGKNPHSAALTLGACIEAAWDNKQGFVSALRGAFSTSYLSLADAAHREGEAGKEYNYRIKAAMCKAAQDHGAQSGSRSLVAGAYGIYSQIVAFLRRDVPTPPPAFTSVFSKEDGDYVGKCTDMAYEMLPEDWAHRDLVMAAVRNAAEDFFTWVSVDDTALGASAAPVVIAPVAPFVMSWNMNDVAPLTVNLDNVLNSISAPEPTKADDGNDDDP